MNVLDYQLTEQDRKDIAAQDELLKHDSGSHDIERCLTDNDGFDRRKFGKIYCGCCGHTFNPFYCKSMKEGRWDYVWVGCDHKQPEADCQVQCPKCKEALRFRIYIGQ